MVNTHGKIVDLRWFLTVTVVLCRTPVLLRDGWGARLSNTTRAKGLNALAEGFVCRCGQAAAEALRRADRELGCVFLFAFNIIGRMKYKNPVCFPPSCPDRPHFLPHGTFSDAHKIYMIYVLYYTCEYIYIDIYI